MTTGTPKEFLNLSTDINTPPPGYFHDVFHLVHAYFDLIRNVSEFATPSKGLVKLYGYRTGTLNLDSSLLEDNYSKAMETNIPMRDKMRRFGNGLIAYNLLTFYQMLSETLTRDILAGRGMENCLTSELVHGVNHFCKIQNRHAPANTRLQLQDSMDALVASCSYNAYFPKGRVQSSEAIIRLIDVLDTLVTRDTASPEMSARQRLTNAVKLLFFIGCSYYELNLLRFSDEIIGRSYERNLDITDFTLAAVPFDPTLIYACADDSTSISRWGIEYVQSLEAVLLYAGGVRYSGILAIEANGNKGVNNV